MSKWALSSTNSSSVPCALPDSRLCLFEEVASERHSLEISVAALIQEALRLLYHSHIVHTVD